MLYDPEANILCIELSQSPVSQAKEFGQFIVHFSKAGKPVIIEILDASKFMGQFDKIRKLKDFKQALPAG